MSKSKPHKRRNYRPTRYRGGKVKRQRNRQRLIAEGGKR